MSDVGQYLSGRTDRDRRPIRFMTFALIVVLAFGVLGTRIFYLQVIDGHQLAAQAETNRTVIQAIAATT